MSDDPTRTTAPWALRVRADRDAAVEAGRQAWRDGSLCIAPLYHRSDLEASWRLGWKKEQGASRVALVSKGGVIADI